MANIVNGTNNSETINVFDGVTNGYDNIFGYGGDDSIFGLGGNDEIIGGAGADALNGGTGSDTASYVYSAAGIIASLSDGVGAGGEAEGDTYASIENLTGANYADALVGNDGNNTLTGVRRRLPRRWGRYRQAVWRIGQRRAQGRRRCRLARRRRGDRYGLLL